MKENLGNINLINMYEITLIDGPLGGQTFVLSNLLDEFIIDFDEERLYYDTRTGKITHTESLHDKREK